MSKIELRLAEWERKKGHKFIDHVKNKFLAARDKAVREKLTLDEYCGCQTDLVKEFECPICINIVDNFTICTSCEKLFCTDCINKSLKRDKRCPMC